MALKGPHSRSYFKDGVQFLAPSHYFELFRKLNVSAVVRLNDEQVSVREGESDGCERGRVEGVREGGRRGGEGGVGAQE